MSLESQEQRCPNCGGAIPPEAPQGLCPKCLLAEVSISTEPAGASKSVPPDPAELARAFPQLDILELVGQGGMGFVFKARQPKLDRFVALKILPKSLAADPAFAERFTREGRVLARLNHPNIVTIHDFGQANGFFYLLMEFVDGVNLRQAMRAGRFSPDQALAIVPKVCEALQYAHNEGILHRDIKPENILLDAKGRVKIADFGIAKLVGEAKPDIHLTGSGATLGTPHYMAPEQVEKPGSVDHRADIYSLGVVFYEMLTGELPLGRFAPPSEKSASDPRLDDVVFRTLEKEPGRRPQSAGEVKTQVETIAMNPPLLSSVGPHKRGGEIAVASVPNKWPARIFWLIVALTGVPVLLVVAYFSMFFSMTPRAVTRDRDIVLGSPATNPVATRAAEANGLTHASKTIELNGATNEIRGDAKEIRIVRVKTDSTLLPGESITARIRHPDGRYEESQTSFFLQRRGNGVATSSYFSWFIPDSYSEAQMEEAAGQLRRNWTHRPINLINARPLLMFAVTNSVGGVLQGYLSFQKTSPGRDKSIATVQPRSAGVGNLLFFYKANVPSGYSLQATVGGSVHRAGEAQTSMATSIHGIDYHCSWHPPESFTAADRHEGDAQLEQLAKRGSFNVDFGRSFRAFSITNLSGEIFEGFFELFGPKSGENQVDAGTAAAAASVAGEETAWPALLPTTNTMRDLAQRVAEGDQAAFDKLRDIAKDLYRDINYTTERERVRTNVYLMRAAFRELGEQAGTNDTAFQALKSAVFQPQLRSHAPDGMGIAAAAGNDQALDMLLHYPDWNISISSAVFAMRAPAEKGNEQAVDFLISVLENPKYRTLWSAAAGGLAAAATTGNARAKLASEKYLQIQSKTPPNREGKAAPPNAR